MEAVCWQPREPVWFTFFAVLSRLELCWCCKASGAKTDSFCDRGTLLEAPHHTPHQRRIGSRAGSAPKIRLQVRGQAAQTSCRPPSFLCYVSTRSSALPMRHPLGQLWSPGNNHLSKWSGHITPPSATVVLFADSRKCIGHLRSVLTFSELAWAKCVLL